ncbi:hypothetical protein AAFF_G00154840 [Aldrovandia affinis]|uniref:Uncharacterized protein n=1 Tax=Aldrovandia affinis TaxID=143900 RepID=A0AAD7T1X4_9TELE|nr:hypothetical protein AAFF_G00154840 [Aldrovandia affinis]
MSPGLVVHPARDREQRAVEGGSPGAVPRGRPSGHLHRDPAPLLVRERRPQASRRTGKVIWAFLLLQGLLSSNKKFLVRSVGSQSQRCRHPKGHSLSGIWALTDVTQIPVPSRVPAWAKPDVSSPRRSLRRGGKHKRGERGSSMTF